MYEVFFLILSVALVIGAYIKKPNVWLWISSILAAIPFLSYVFDYTGLGTYNAFVAFVSLSAALAMFFSGFALDRYPTASSLIIASAMGALVAAMSKNRLRIIVGRELGSVPTYLLVAYEGRYEAAKKYASVGIIGSTLMLLGLVMYAISMGTLELLSIVDDTLARIGAIFILTGMLVKLPVFPVHGRLVDVFDNGYSRSLPRIASGTKVVVFAALTYAVVKSLGVYDIRLYLAILIAISMTYANIAALYEEDVLRILAYSTIAHASYAAIALAALTNQALIGMRIHILGTAAMKGGLLAFIVVEGIRNLEDLAGLVKRRRIAVAFIASVLSLIGIPPFIGFRSKYRLFMGSVGTDFRRLAVLLIINTVISIGYYGKLITKAFEDGEPKAKDHRLLAIAIVIVLMLSLLPRYLFDFASEAISAVM